MSSAITWNIDDVCGWLSSHGLDHLSPTFRQNQIDGRSLLSLTKEELREELRIQALSDRKLLWEKLEALQGKSPSPPRSSPRVAPTPISATVVTSSSSSSPSRARDTCDHCYHAFGANEIPVILTLPGNGKTGRIHKYCQNEWSRAHARRCDHCHEPMVSDVTTISGVWGSADVHPGCVSAFEAIKVGSPGSERCEHCLKRFSSADSPILLTLPGASRSAKLHRLCKADWARLHAKRCDHCHEPMPTDITTLSGAWGTAEVHPACTAAFEASLANGWTRRTPSPRSSPRSPRSMSSSPPGGRCEHCLRLFEPHDVPILLTLPGAARAAELHPGCKREWSLKHAKRCDHCHEPMPVDITTLTGAWGRAEVHPECVPAFENSLKLGIVPPPSLNRPRSSPSPDSGDRCEHCLRRFTAHDSPILLTLPGSSTTAKLHPGCKSDWARLHAKQCDHCFQPMPTDITVLSGAWGRAEVHPECVAAYEDTHRRMSPTSYSDRCEHCLKRFGPNDLITTITLPGAIRSARLHHSCRQAWSSTHSKRCDHCYHPMPNEITRLSGTSPTGMPWSAEVHPTCATAYTSARQAMPATTSPKSSPLRSRTSPIPATLPGGAINPEYERAATSTGLPIHPSSFVLCHHCMQPVKHADTVVLLSIPGLPKEVQLHEGCVDPFHRAQGNVCAWCSQTIRGTMTRVTHDSIGSAKLHPECVPHFNNRHGLR